MQAYFAKCQEKLGFVPNVLPAYGFDNAKLEAFAGMYNDLMLAPSGPVQASTPDDRGRSVIGEPLLLLPGGARSRGARAVRRSGAGRIDGDELSRCALEQAPARDARLRHQAYRRAMGNRGHDREDLRKAGFTERDIWDIAAVAGFYNMSNRVASATDMRPNAVYHGQAR